MSYPITSRFARALRYPHQAVFRVEAWFQGQQITPPRYLRDGLPITPGGAVTVDAGSQTRRALSCTIADPGLTPADAQSLLAPYGAELWPFRGIQFPDGTRELIPLGRFRIDSATPSDPAGVPGPTGIDMTGTDYSSWTVEGRFFLPTKATHTTVNAEIAALVGDTMPPGTPALSDLTGRTKAMPAHMTYSDFDRMGAVTKLATLMHAEFFMDPVGVPTLRNLKAPANDPNWTVDAGPGGVMLKAAAAVDRANIYNAVIVTGQKLDGSAAGWGLARDLDPTSPTFWGGPFGKKPAFVNSAVVTGNGACEDLAQQILDSYVGVGWTLMTDTLVNPALEAGDVIQVNLPDGRLQRHVVEKFTVPLDTTTPMSIETRSNDPGGDSA